MSKAKHLSEEIEYSKKVSKAANLAVKNLKRVSTTGVVLKSIPPKPKKLSVK